MPRIVLLEFRGQRFAVHELAELSGVPAGVIRARLSHGWTVEQAVVIPTPDQRRRGVVANFDVFLGTGARSTAQETPEITFSEEANS